MVSDPLTNNKPVKRFNLPNSPGSAPTQLVTCPVPSSLSSLFPFHPSALPPPPAADFAAGNRNFGGISPDSDRYVADPAAGKARGLPRHPDRISLFYRRKTTTRVRISVLAPGKKGMRGYFAMVMLVDVDLS